MKQRVSKVLAVMMVAVLMITGKADAWRADADVVYL